MNQTPPASPTAQRLSESVVGELIGRPGIDLVLIDARSLAEPGSTARLTLQSLGGDFAFLDWVTTTAAVEQLNASGIAGHRSPHPDDEVELSSKPTARRIYAFDLNRYSDALPVCQAIHRLLADRQTKTFTLAPTPRSRPVAETLAREPRQPFRAQGDTFSEKGGDATGNGPNRDRIPASGAAPQPADQLTPKLAASPPPALDAAAGGAGVMSESELDQLVDQLNDDFV